MHTTASAAAAVKFRQKSKIVAPRTLFLQHESDVTGFGVTMNTEHHNQLTSIYSLDPTLSTGCAVSLYRNSNAYEAAKSIKTKQKMIASLAGK
jgi:hypothetical protein